jgi:pimeloyl-ACP methyl ester carboxylesterase
MMAHLHYTRTGDKALLMFHGYGQDASVFKDIEGYSIDLFFHGGSKWNKGEEPLEKNEWKQIVSEFLEQNNIKDFSVLGFSMGARFALATLEAFPDRVKEIILLAPDGIKTSPWYSLATYPIAFRKFFKSMISNHARFSRIARISNQLGLIDKGVLRFVEAQMDSEEKRKRVYYSWVVFRHLKFDVKKIAAMIDQYNIKIRLYVGKYDKIITAKNMKGLTSNVQIIEAGHNDLIRKVKPLIFP